MKRHRSFQDPKQQSDLLENVFKINLTVDANCWGLILLGLTIKTPEDWACDFCYHFPKSDVFISWVYAMFSSYMYIGKKKTFRQIESQQTCSSLRDEPPLRILPTWSQTSAQYNNHYTCKPCKLKLMKKREKLKRQLLTTSIFCSPTFWVTIWKNILCHHVQKSVTNAEL